MKHIRILIAAALVAACQDQAPTAIDRRAALEGEARVMTQAIDDVIDRVVPALSDASEAVRLSAALENLRGALDAGRLADAPGMARAAQAEVERYARATRKDAAELDVVSLALSRVIDKN